MAEEPKTHLVWLAACLLLLACETRTGGDEVVVDAEVEGGTAGAAGDAAPDADTGADAATCTEPGQPCDGVGVTCCDGLCGREGICPVYED